MIMCAFDANVKRATCREKIYIHIGFKGLEKETNVKI